MFLTLFNPIRIFFSHFEIQKTLCFSALDTTQKCRPMLAKGMSESQPIPRAFSEFITYQIAMENDKTKYKSREN